jgi:hypothetical protein
MSIDLWPIGRGKTICSFWKVGLACCASLSIANSTDICQMWPSVGGQGEMLISMIAFAACVFAVAVFTYFWPEN